LIKAYFELRGFLSQRAVHFRGNAADGVLNRLLGEGEVQLHAYMIADVAGR
jgi:hypothetical protein